MGEEGDKQFSKSWVCHRYNRHKCDPNDPMRVSRVYIKALLQMVAWIKGAIWPWRITFFFSHLLDDG